MFIFSNLNYGELRNVGMYVRVCVYVCVCMYVCMYVSMYECTYVYIYVLCVKFSWLFSLDVSGPLALIRSLVILHLLNQ